MCAAWRAAALTLCTASTATICLLILSHCSGQKLISSVSERIREQAPIRYGKKSKKIWQYKSVKKRKGNVINPCDKPEQEFSLT